MQSNQNSNTDRHLVWDTDKWFEDSPDCGDEKCLCSRCGEKILYGESALRGWETNEKGEVTRDSKEWRICEHCSKGKKYFFCEYEKSTMMRCKKQCKNCKENPDHY